MKTRIFSHSAYCIGLPALAALCLWFRFDGGLTPRIPDYVKRQIVYQDVPAGLRGWLEEEGFRAADFADRIEAINRSTEERELRGEWDHLIFFLLQSRRFTKREKIEPALSAYEFVGGLSAAESREYLADGPEPFRSAPPRSEARTPPEIKMPKAARARMEDFLGALRAGAGRGEDERMAYFRAFLKKAVPSSEPLGGRLYLEYARTMRFLYRKEFASRNVSRERVAAYVASLYRDRGHSTDTQIESNFAVYTALAALKAGEKASRSNLRLDRVLIIGPGLDFAPRTDFVDLFGPQSYQPFAVADALLSLSLCDPAKLRIDCADINERVISHLQNLRRGEVTLSILSGVSDSPGRPLSEEYKAYFRALGGSLGEERAIQGPPRSAELTDLAARLKKSLRVRPEVTDKIGAARLNVITERIGRADGSPANYDLVVVTNVFPYFSPPEALLALTNISAMLAEGGYLIHNELQTLPASFFTPLGLPLRQARTVSIAPSATAPLFDGVAIHQKTKFDL